MVLVKEAGYDLDAIRGTRETATVEQPPSSAARFVGSLSRSRAYWITYSLLLLGSALALLTAAATPLLVAGIAAAVALGLSRFEPTPTTIQTTVESPGMSVDEVMGRLHQHDEHEQMKQEQQEAQARKAKRQGGQ